MNFLETHNRIGHTLKFSLYLTIGTIIVTGVVAVVLSVVAIVLGDVDPLFPDLYQAYVRDLISQRLVANGNIDLKLKMTGC
jgi:hypothetical protein